MPPVSPRCPHCSINPLRLGIQTTANFSLVFCGTCGAIFGVVPKITESSSVETKTPAKTTTPPPTADETLPPAQSTPDLLAEIGQADLSQKIPYDPEAIARRMRAAGGAGSRYLRVAVENKPPCCLVHKTEMIRTTIPAGYKNSGREVWICPQFKTCHQWELAK